MRGSFCRTSSRAAGVAIGSTFVLAAGGRVKNPKRKPFFGGNQPDVATHSVASLGESSFASNGVFPSRYSAILQPICLSSPLILPYIPAVYSNQQGRSLIMH